MTKKKVPAKPAPPKPPVRRPLKPRPQRPTPPPETMPPVAPSATCLWMPDPAGYYTSSCGRSWAFVPGNGPADAGMKFCPFCGKEMAL